MKITLDLSSSMRKIARLSFPKATQVIDRFHVQKLASEALQEMRIDFRWDAIHEENKLMTEYRAALKRGEDVEPYEPPVYANDDTRKQLLARSRYLLFKSREKWTESQKARAKILFNQEEIHCVHEARTVVPSRRRSRIRLFPSREGNRLRKLSGHPELL